MNLSECFIMKYIIDKENKFVIFNKSKKIKKDDKMFNENVDYTKIYNR